MGMIHTLTRFESWILHKIIRALVARRPHHHTNMAEVMRMVCDESRSQFYEDNDSTQYCFLRDAFEQAIDATLTHHADARKAYK